MASQMLGVDEGRRYWGKIGKEIKQTYIYLDVTR